MLDQLINFCGEVTDMVDTRRAVDIIYLDFRSAFDTVSHGIPIKKLLMYGLDEQTGKLI